MVSRPDIFKQAAEGGLSSALEATANFRENMVLMGIESGSIGESLYRSTSAARKFADLENEKKEEKRRDEQRFINLITQLQHDLANLEARIARDYGENFAEDLLADLHDKGKVSDEEVERLRSITDDRERRQAIGTLIQEKRRGGEVTADDLKDTPWVEEWLQKREALDAQVHDAAVDIMEHNKSLEGVDSRVLDKIEEIKAAQGESQEDVKKHILKEDVYAKIPDSTVSADEFTFS